MQPVCRPHTDTNLLFFGTAIRATNSAPKAKCGRSRKGAQDPTVLPSCPHLPKRQRGASRLAVTKATLGQRGGAGGSSHQGWPLHPPQQQQHRCAPRPAETVPLQRLNCTTGQLARLCGLAGHGLTLIVLHFMYKDPYYRWIYIHLWQEYRTQEKVDFCNVYTY